MWIPSDAHLTQFFQEMTIVHSCDESEREGARDMVKNYYDAFLQNDWKEIQESRHETLYSSFCRRITKGLNEVCNINKIAHRSVLQNSFVLNMTRYNNQQLERIKIEVKQMLLDH